MAKELKDIFLYTILDFNKDMKENDIHKRRLTNLGYRKNLLTWMMFWCESYAGDDYGIDVLGSILAYNNLISARSIVDTDKYRDHVVIPLFDTLREELAKGYAVNKKNNIGSLKTGTITYSRNVEFETSIAETIDFDAYIRPIIDTIIYLHNEFGKDKDLLRGAMMLLDNILMSEQEINIDTPRWHIENISKIMISSVYTPNLKSSDILNLSHGLLLWLHKAKKLKDYYVKRDISVYHADQSKSLKLSMESVTPSDCADRAKLLNSIDTSTNNNDILCIHCLTASLDITTDTYRIITEKLPEDDESHNGQILLRDILISVEPDPNVHEYIHRLPRAIFPGMAGESNNMLSDLCIDDILWGHPIMYSFNGTNRLMSTYGSDGSGGLILQKSLPFIKRLFFYVNASKPIDSITILRVHEDQWILPEALMGRDLNGYYMLSSNNQNINDRIINMSSVKSFDSYIKQGKNLESYAIFFTPIGLLEFAPVPDFSFNYNTTMNISFPSLYDFTCQKKVRPPEYDRVEAQKENFILGHNQLRDSYHNNNFVINGLRFNLYLNLMNELKPSLDIVELNTDMLKKSENAAILPSTIISGGIINKLYQNSNGEYYNIFRDEVDIITNVMHNKVEEE